MLQGGHRKAGGGGGMNRNSVCMCVCVSGCHIQVSISLGSNSESLSLFSLEMMRLGSNCVAAGSQVEVSYSHLAIWEVFNIQSGWIVSFLTSQLDFNLLANLVCVCVCVCVCFINFS